MVMRSIRRLMLVFVAAVMLVMPGVAIANQGSYDTLRVQLDDGTEVLYRVWTTWPQLLLTTPDGGAFGFFTAQAGTIDAPYKLYVARFDPTAAKWSDATAVPGGQIQFGVTGAVDSNGVAHVVFTDRAADSADSFGKLVYMHSNPDGTWTTPVNVNDNADAGHQLAPSMVVDAQNVLHLVWQDQRTVTPELRAASPSNAAILSCDLTADGVCSADPAVISTPSTPTEIANRPRIATDGQRVVATWSVYAGTTDEQLASASQIAWNSKPLGDPNAAWTGQQVLVELGQHRDRRSSCRPDERSHRQCRGCLRTSRRFHLALYVQTRGRADGLVGAGSPRRWRAGIIPFGGCRQRRHGLRCLQRERHQQR